MKAYRIYNHISTEQPDSISLRMKIALGFVFGIIIGVIISVAGRI